MSIRAEVDCLERYARLSNSLEDIMVFLLEEKIATPDEIKSVRSSADAPRSLQSLMYRIKGEGRIQLLEYNWEVLPVERIKIVIVTDRNSKEFVYNT